MRSVSYPDGMVVVFSGPGTSLGSLGQAHDRSVCDVFQQTSPSLCVTSSRFSSLGGRRSVLQLGRSHGLRVPSSSSHSKSPQEGGTGFGVPHSDRSSLAGPGVVSGSVASVSRSSVSSKVRRSRSSSTSFRCPSREPSNAVSSRLETVRSGLRSLGSSQEVLDLVQSAHRSSTASVYDSHWRNWCFWCVRKRLDPLHPSPVVLANHLAFMSNTLKLSPSCLRVRRAAVCRTLSQAGLAISGDMSVVSDVIKGAALRSARAPRRFPAWDLFKVLEFLRGPPFEPLKEASFENLTKKTLFLVTLALGRRASEVAGLSGLIADVSFEFDGSMSLQFLPEFLAKNQIPGDPSPTLFVRSLSDLVSSSELDSLNCPVRALKLFRARSAQRRGPNQRALFLSLNAQYHKDISRPTLAKWISSVIKSSYRLSSQRGGGLSVPESWTPRAHEMRAWATSLAASHSTNITDVLKAAYWRSTDVFISHYLRDVARRREDDSFGLPLVASQVILNSRH